MTSDLILVGDKNCSSNKIVSILKSSPAFELFFEKWADVARDLGISSGTISIMRSDLRLDKLTINDVACKVIDLWIGCKGNDATLRVLILALAENGLNACAESLQKEFLHSSPSSSNDIKKFSQIPNKLMHFLSEANSNKSICIMRSIDIQITVEKLQENIKIRSNFNTIGNFLLFLQASNIINDGIPFVTVNTEEELEQILKIFINNELSFSCKVLLICSKSLDHLDIFDKYPSFHDNVYVVEDTMKWEDLTIPYQYAMQTRLYRLLNIQFISADLKRLIRGQLLADLIHERELKLFHNPFPENLSIKYYIPRTLVSRSVISDEIFNQNSNDIFIFNGMDRSELSVLAGNQITSTTREQLCDIKVKFMILDQENHFEKIFRKTTHPVHLLRRKSGTKFQWVTSRRGVKAIQGHVSNIQDYHTEDNFIKMIMSDELNSLVIISDSPGMGKSVLLAKIGKKIKCLHPEKLVFFLGFGNFMRQVKKIYTRDELDIAIEETLCKMVCQNLVGEAVLHRKLQYEKTFAVELLLDGFDELDLSDHNLAFEVLNIFKTSYKAIRIWITSRPHLLEQLENHFTIFGYKIDPFSNKDQVEFLVSYWSQKSVLSDKENLRIFANECLNILNLCVNYDHQDIAGIPLQCFLIGENFEEDAMEYSKIKKGDGRKPSVRIEIISIPNLYRKLIQKKMQKYKNTYNGYTGEKLSLHKVLNMHVLFGLELIFPEQVWVPEQLLVPEVNIDKLLKVGMLESTKTTTDPQFVHRTFAEYFVAWFVADKVKLNQLDDFATEVLLKIFEAEEINIVLFGAQNILSYRFKHWVICCFLESLCREHVPICWYQSSFFAGKFDNPLIVKQIAYSCVNGQFVKLFQFLIRNKIFEQNAAGIFDKEFVLVTISTSSLEIIKLVLNYFESHHEFDLKLQTRILRSAVHTGDFSIFEFLVKEKCVGTLQNLNAETRLLLHDCVVESRDDATSLIDQKIQIVQLLVTLSNGLLEEKGEYGRTPLLQEHVHLRLLIKLANLGANVLAQDVNGQTIIHLNFGRGHLSSEDFHLLLGSISCPNKLVNEMDESGDTPLIKLLKKLDPLPSTLDRLHELNTNFNSEDEYGYSVLAVAIRSGRNKETIKKLINCGCDISWTGDKGISPLHVAAEFGNTSAVDILLGEKASNVSAVDDDGLTPLNYAIRSSCVTCCDTGMALKKHGGIFMQVVNQNGQSLLHLAVLEENVQSVQLLLCLGVYVNLIDNQGNTPLHLAVENASSNYEVTKCLLNYNANPNLANKENQTVFTKLLKYGNFDLQTFLLIKSKTNVSYSSPLLATLILKITVQKGEYLRNGDFHSLCRELEENNANFYQIDTNGNSLLHTAAENGNWNALKLLVKGRKLNINVKNNFQETALHLAARNGEISVAFEIVKYLIKFGADITAKNDKNLTFLHCYVMRLNSESHDEFYPMIDFLAETKHSNFLEIMGGRYGSTPVHLAFAKLELQKKTLTLLKSLKFNFNMVDRDRGSVLAYAIIGRRSISLISTLINTFSCNPTQLNDNKENVLHTASYFGTSEVLKFLLDLDIVSCNAKNSCGNTPLHCVFYSKWDRNEILTKCKLLISKAAHVNLTNQWQLSPLHLSAVGDDKISCLEVLKFLISNGANVFAKDSDNLTFLHHYVSQACSPSSDQFHMMVELLLEKDYTILFYFHGGTNGNTPLQIALSRMNIELRTLAMLKSAGLDFNSVDNGGRSLLAYAIIGGQNPNVLSALISHGADPFHLNHNNENLLHTAAFWGSAGTLKFFLDLNILNLKAQNFDGNSVLHFAIHPKSRHIDVLAKCKLLVSRDVDVNVTNSWQQTALHLAAVLKNKGISHSLVRLLTLSGADVMIKDNRNFTFLHHYVMQKELPTLDQLHNMMEFLVGEKFFNLFKIRCGEHKATPVHEAIYRMELERKTLSLLQSANFDFNSVDKNGFSILTYAIKGNRSMQFLTNLIKRYKVDPTQV